MRAIVVRPLLVAAAMFMIAGAALALPAPARAADEMGVTFKLTVLGDVPEDAQFTLVDTSPGRVVDRVLWFCGPAPGFAKPCQSGKTYTYRITEMDAGQTFQFHYEAVLDGRRITLYEGQAAPTQENPHPTFRVTYDFNLSLPNTAFAPEVGTHAGPWAVVATTVLLVMVAAARFRRYPRP
jgi:hypothetical protein